MDDNNPLDLANGRITVVSTGAADAPIPAESVLARWVIKLSGGIVKTEDQANNVLIGVIVVATVVAAFLFFIGLSGGGTSTKSNATAVPPGYQLDTTPGVPPRLTKPYNPAP